MQTRQLKRVGGAISLLMCAGAMFSLSARAASCKTQSQMTAAQRDSLSSVARMMMRSVQSGDVNALQAIAVPSVGADFNGIAASVESLKPLVQQAAITVDNLYSLDAASETAGATRTDFYCGAPLVVLNFTDLPPGMYALVILHATGVPHPQQITLILSEASDHRWLLGGFFSRPMMEAGHDGLWYWVAARKYAHRNMTWDAWLYYRLAASCLDPVEFLSSPNLEMLQHEQEEVHPQTLPGAKPLLLDAHGSVFQVTSVETTTALGALDLEVHYAPDSTQAKQLSDPPTARKQVTDLMLAMLALHPELHEAFHGIWVQADQGSTSAFSLELTMDQIAPAASLGETRQNLVAQ